MKSQIISVSSLQPLMATIEIMEFQAYEEFRVNSSKSNHMRRLRDCKASVFVCTCASPDMVEKLANAGADTEFR